MPLLDCTVTPILRSKEDPAAHGLFIAAPPRRASRNRAADHLLLHLAFSGSTIPQDELPLLFEQVTRTYYQTSGATTSAMRTLTEALNNLLLNRNLQRRGRGTPSLAWFTLLTLRGDVLYLAQSGPTALFVKTATEAHGLHDPALSGRGLGMSRTLQLRFQYLPLHPNDILLLTARPSPAWTLETFSAAAANGIEPLRQTLVAQTAVDWGAALLQAQPGAGQFVLRLGALAHKTENLIEATPQAAPPAEFSAAPKNIPPASEGARGLMGVAESQEPAPPNAAPVGALPPSPPPDLEPATPAPKFNWRARLPTVQVPRAQLAGAALKVGESTRRAVSNAGAAMRILLARLLPDESLLTLPTNVMAFVALTVPVILIAIATAVYWQRGREGLYRAYFQEAQAIAVAAVGETDPTKLRQVWRETLAALDGAERFQVTSESQSLRQYASHSLDDLDGIERLDYQDALTTVLPPVVQITRILASGDDLYLLNGADGSVLHATRSAVGYTVALEFTCGPQPTIGPLVDIALMPLGNTLRAELLGMDANGNILYCFDDQPPLVAPLPTPDSGWGNPKAMTLDGNSMYLLDPQTNAVWVYRGLNENFDGRPRFFFSEQVPSLRGALDLSVNRSDLYILHDDGHLTTCVYSSLPDAPTRCEDPAIYTDFRPGYESGATLPGARFVQIAYQAPPDPSLYLLDAPNQAVYHLSLRLALQRQWQPREPLSGGAATAFTLSPDRVLFLAIGNRVYYAALP
ncbi:MAG: hypothetical protein OHK0052_03840 [Anaerolineales bacterium]